ncbi:MAG: SMP-30/gluconolactonase/LRE family protein [Gemmatimonadaceae bacterium]
MPTPVSVPRLSLLLALVIAMASAADGQQTPLGAFDGHGDIGVVRRSGSATYDSTRQTYEIAGSGANMWGESDHFHFVWKRMTGDFILTTRAQLVGRGVDPHRKLGWTVRSTLDAGSPHVTAAVHGDGLTALQFRRSIGSATEEARSSLTGVDVIQLERKGDSYIMSVARFGDTLVATRVSVPSLGKEVYVGLFVCAHRDSVVERGAFRDVRITVPARDDLVPYRDHLGSNLETIDIASGARTIVYRSPESLQAPNWTRDGKALIYNVNGRLVRFDLGTRTPSPLSTGDVTRNNNDHVLSFDGRTIGISAGAPDDQNRSNVYIVPLEGGTPRRLTALGPSYLHGWSPDGRFVVYTGQRDGDFDIYRLAVDGGAETRLTTAKGLDDGPEYTPDGRYIYFNSVRSGSMQIWRMRPDGSDQEQVTSDGYNNWFPHISPDGKWIVFLSFGPDVPPGDHPWYKRVYIRIMAAAGGPTRVLAYVYGGQGTINVPSWSPDSRRLAFVSNTDMR